ncbi:MAG: NADH-quinone oxidoreductase subunit A [Thermoanaerobaculales bacterium]|nr:NADH-quinone oxidoreductase subunit A [Thermoanaerobaculales bacterium]
MAQQFLPVLMILLVAGTFAVLLLGISALLGQRTRQRTKARAESYESGVPLLDRARKRISIKFYLVALVFVVLDVEVAFLYPWAVNYRDLTSTGSLVPLWDMVAFLGLLALTYAYLWRKGVFDWGRRRSPAPEEGHGR